MPSSCVLHRVLRFLSAGVFSLAATTAFAADPVSLPEPIAPGPFTSAPESLRQYQAPEWFRDAKFGIWAHWGPQAVPGQGDWYARNMYIQGKPQYEHHLKTYGHPSKAGYKDIIPLWKAEKWDPAALMDLYVKAGAKYFVSMGVHHDNFDLWDSKYHTWNATKMGPKRDIVGEWQREAKKHGLRFGVSEHLGASYAWFAPSHESDKTGALAGVPYDGADPKYGELYHPAHKEPWTGGPSWYAKDPKWHAEWYLRVKDLVDHYQPDLLYTDGGIPFGEFGRSLVAHFYNADQARHGGKVEAVYAHKKMDTGEFIREAGAQDVERGGMEGINPLPWQTDTSIGDWYYSENYKYKTTSQVVHALADIVSKNGNLLLNVVLYADGSLPPEPRRFLDEMAQWIAVNGDAIYGTRPWKTFGEGPTVMKAGHFKEDFPFAPADIRFTTKAGKLYALTLGVPTEQIRIKSLGKDAPFATRPVAEVRLLGYDGKLAWSQQADALVIEAPEKFPTEHAAAFEISFAPAK